MKLKELGSYCKDCETFFTIIGMTTCGICGHEAMKTIRTLVA
jgi:rRNA maturation endonuclease Nob1